MPDDVVLQRRFPVGCPACGVLAGYPTVVQTVRMRAGHLRIDISCHACRHEWFQEVEADQQ
ncbi:MAG TPA: hypothetical protein VFZ31_11510 [Vicinamibacterales bacterium]